MTIQCAAFGTGGKRYAPGLAMSFKDPTTGAWRSATTSAAGVKTARFASSLTVLFSMSTTAKFTLPMRVQFSPEAWNGTWRMEGKISGYSLQDTNGQTLDKVLAQSPELGGSIEVTGGTEKPRNLPANPAPGTTPPRRGGCTQPAAVPSPSEVPASPSLSPEAASPEPSVSTPDGADDVAAIPISARQGPVTGEVLAAVVVVLLAADGLAVYLRRRRSGQTPIT